MQGEKFLIAGNNLYSQCLNGYPQRLNMYSSRLNKCSQSINKEFKIMVSFTCLK